MSQRLQLLVTSSEHLREFYGSLIKTSFWRSSDRAKTLACHKVKVFACLERATTLENGEPERVVLSERDFSSFVEAIESPTRPTEALLSLMRSRRSSGR